MGIEGGLTDSRQNLNNPEEVYWSIRIDVDARGFHVNTQKRWKKERERQWRGENWRVQKNVADPQAFYERIRQIFYNRTGYFDENGSRDHSTSSNILKGMFLGGTYPDDI